MNQLDPKSLLERIATDLPDELRAHLFVTGSIAAAYRYRTQLRGNAINTKDADLVIHPAADVKSCSEIADVLLKGGWEKTEDCRPQADSTPADKLRAIRLYPPNSKDYFVEFLNVPSSDQAEAKLWIPVKLQDGWYGLPSFRFMGIAALERDPTPTGLECATPSMMALANLLSHPVVGTVRIESGAMSGLLRSAKDLGRVLALTWLEGREGTEQWRIPWQHAVQECFPESHGELLRGIGAGLEELLSDDNAMEDARKSTDLGLLNGNDVSSEMLRATGQRLMSDVIQPLRESAKSSESN